MPNPPHVGVSSDTSNITAIVDAVFSIARDHSGINWAGSTEWDLPAVNAVTGMPWLAVTWPRFVEYSVGYGSVGEFLDGSSEVQFTWDIDVYCLAPYTANNSKTYSTPTAAAASLIHTFTLYDNLNGTCDVAKVGKPELVKISQKAPNAINGQSMGAGAPLWFAAIITVRAIEDIAIVYN